MKRFHYLSLIIGMVLGFVIASALPHAQNILAEERNAAALSEEELDKKLDELLESQKDLKKRIETVATQSQFLKAASGK